MLKNDVFINSIRFVVLVLIQVLILNHVNFLGYINPYLYILFILLYPLTGNKSLLIFLGFILGLSIDMFGDSGGVHAAACVTIAFLRPLILKFSFGVSYEYNTIRIHKTDFSNRLIYVFLMVLIHHLILFLLEVFNIDHILLVLKNTLFSGIFSMVLILGTIALFSRNVK